MQRDKDKAWLPLNLRTASIVIWTLLKSQFVYITDNAHSPVVILWLDECCHLLPVKCGESAWTSLLRWIEDSDETVLKSVNMFSSDTILRIRLALISVCLEPMCSTASLHCLNQQYTPTFTLSHCALISSCVLQYTHLKVLCRSIQLKTSH